MKILLINDHVHISGGGDVVLNSEREYLKQCGHEVFVYGWSSESSSEDSSVILCKESKSKLLRHLSKFLGSPSKRRHFRKVLNQIKPDVIHIHLISKYPLSIYPELKGYKVVQTLHGPNLFCATSWGCIKSNSGSCSMGIGYKCYRNRCIRFHEMLAYGLLNYRLAPYLKNYINCWHCPSRNILKTAVGLGFSNTVYIPLGIDKEYHDCIHRGCNLKEKNILFVGALAEVKGLTYLYDAFRIVQQKEPTARLIIAGSGNLYNYLENKIKSDNNETFVELLGKVPHHQVIELYKRASLFVMPSIWQEQFGLVGPEALAMGLPVVGSDIGGIPEWLHHGEWGYLVPPRDTEGLATRILELLNNPKQSYDFGQKGRTFVMNEYNYADYVERMRSLIHSIHEDENFSQNN